VSPAWTEVVAAALIRADGSYLLAQRPPGKVYAGYWEFPGGKVERGETSMQAIIREIREELGVTITEATPWLTRTHVYAHASVRLRFFRATAWQGELQRLDGQDFAFQTPGQETVGPMLPANGPLLAAMALPAFYAITFAEEIGEEAMLSLLDDASKYPWKGRFGLVQVREKGWPLARRLAFLRNVCELLQPRGVRVVFNGDALEAPADGIHLTVHHLMGCTARPSAPLVGASVHTQQELAHAAALGLDYVLLGAVNVTRSHADAKPLGWEGFRSIAADAPLPVYALGGLHAHDLTTAMQHGAHGVAMMRGINRLRPTEGGSG
jgi:8-oxo-dGTP diphosphatase